MIAVKPNHDCERERTVLVEHICVVLFRCLLYKRLSFILCLNELILFEVFKSEDRLFYILGQVGQVVWPVLPLRN